MSLWRLTNMTGPSRDTRKDPRGNIVLESAPAVLTLSLVIPAGTYRSADTLLVYEQADNGKMAAWHSVARSGAGSTNVTHLLPDEEWRGMLAQAQAAKALTGKVPEFEKELPL